MILRIASNPLTFSPELRLLTKVETTELPQDRAAFQCEMRDLPLLGSEVGGLTIAGAIGQSCPFVSPEFLKLGASTRLMQVA